MPTPVTAAHVARPGGPLAMRELCLEDPQPHEILVRIAAAGVCHTDLSVLDQVTPFPLPAVLGHEGAGEVAAVGCAVTTVAVGDRVVLSFASCGRCPACLGGQPVYCVQWVELNLLGGSRLDGTATLHAPGGEPVHGHFFGQSSMATYALCDERAAVRIDADIPFEILAPLGCGVQTGACSVLKLLRPTPGSTMAIFGAGAVGLTALLAAHLTPASRVIVLDINESRLALARELGATGTVNSADADPVAAIRDLTGGRGVDFAIETSGRTAVLEQAVAALTERGTCCVIGAPALGSRAGLNVTDLLSRGLSVIGTNQGGSVPAVDIPRLVELYRRGRLPYDRLIRTFPFERADRALESMRSGTSIKPVLVMPSSNP